MSAFVVENKTINIVVSYIMNQFFRQENAQLKEKLNNIGYDPDKDKSFFNKLAVDMFYLNVEAVDQRYGAGNKNILSESAAENMDIAKKESSHFKNHPASRKAINDR